jgi:glycerol-3-phosphate responsive antiterminator
MWTESGPVRLPAILIATDGRHPAHPPDALDAGILVRDTDLAALVHLAGGGPRPEAVDIDGVAGLGSDDAAVDFVTDRLGIRIVLSRRPQLAERAAARGHLGLVHIFAYDSTGMNRSLDAHPRSPNVGSVVSPGLVIVHLRREEVEAMPQPVVAYGFIDSIEEAAACARLAESIVVRPAVAARLAAAAAGIGTEPERV